MKRLIEDETKLQILLSAERLLSRLGVEIRSRAVYVVIMKKLLRYRTKSEIERDMAGPA